MSLARTAFGERRRVMDQAEKRAAYQLEQLFGIHLLDWWHCTVAQKSQAGWPDYVVLGKGWHAFLELKATSLNTNRRGKVSAAQYRYKDSIEAAGGEWVTFCLPDDLPDCCAWLTAHTGISARVV